MYPLGDNYTFNNIKAHLNDPFSTLSPHSPNKRRKNFTRDYTRDLSLQNKALPTLDRDNKIIIIIRTIRAATRRCYRAISPRQASLHPLRSDVGTRSCRYFYTVFRLIKVNFQHVVQSINHLLLKSSTYMKGIVGFIK